MPKNVLTEKKLLIKIKCILKPVQICKHIG